ncbi:hypothetical protein HK097_008547 [Rhizophlyctis rosea]|uniref:Proteasome activator subunit 4 n=1 Tax=Rhizophlyctis rosea TaxID=64517 RepID=A0AAD5X4H5_9FUNG|nr:hypothetical protein HK097_008547 [Rhizophlyctis rosea]
MADTEPPPVDWNTALPYDTAAAGARWIEDISQGLAVATAAGDFAPGCIYWSRQLNSYLDLKYTLTTEQRVRLAKILYELIVTPGMDISLVGSFASLCTQLIKKEKLIPTDQLILQWRPLYDIIQRNLYPRQKEKVYPGAGRHAPSVMKLVMYANRFFPPEATAEILEELLPDINIHDLQHTQNVQSLLVFFLPVSKPPPTLTNIPNAPPFYWVPTMFSLWSMVANLSSYDGLYIELLANLAEKQVATPETVGWTDAQIRHVFSVGLRSFDLPVGGTGDGRGPGAVRVSHGSSLMNMLDAGRKNRTVEAFAKFIIYTIYPSSADAGQSHPSKSLEHLATMIRSVESYFHPSNSGRWGYQLARFIQVLASEFLRRLRKEDKPTCETPQRLRLTKSIAEDFVTILRPVALSAMFGKDQIAVLSIHGCLKNLAWIEPQLIIPSLLERIYPGLETLTETHRTLTSLGTLWSISIPLLNRRHFPQGGRHLPALLELTLPGIDLNDPAKTSAALMFITHAAMCAPLVDLTKGHRGAGGAPVGGRRNSMVEVDAGDDESARMEVDEEEEDEACRLGTAEFEGWAAKFLDRIFVMEHGKAATNRTMETNLIQLVMYACELVFAQMSPDLQDVSLRKLVNFVSFNVVPNATKAIGTLCTLVGGNEPSKRLAAFLPLCHDRILAELNNGAASDSTSSTTGNPFGFASMSDASLHWWQAILFNLVGHSGAELLKYRKEMTELMTASVEICHSKRGYKWAGKLLRFALVDLTAIYPLEIRSQGKARWHDPEFINNSHKYWAEPGDIRNLDIDWHVPSQEEIDWALEIINHFVPLCISKLRELSGASAQKLDTRKVSNEFSKWLTLLRNLIIGFSTLVPPKSTDREPSTDAEDPFIPQFKKQPVSAGYCFANAEDERLKRVEELREEIGTVLHDVAVYLEREREDDTGAIQAVVKSVKMFLTHRGVDRGKFEGQVRGYKYAKVSYSSILLADVGRGVWVNKCLQMSIKVADDEKRHPRYMLVKRAHLLHLARLKYNSSQSAHTSIVTALTDDLSHLSLGKYSQIRKAAQSALTRAIRCFPGEKYRLFGRFIEGLEVGADGRRDPDRMKGSLYLLKSSGFLGLALRDWRHAGAFMETLSRAQHEDKPSVLELIRKVFLEYLMQAGEMPIDVAVTEGAKESAGVLGHVGDGDGEIQRLRSKVAQKASESRDRYHQLMQSLLTILNGNTLHWRFGAMTVNFLDLILRSDEPVPLSLTRFVAEGAVSEHPAMRKVCLTVLYRILIILKLRAVKANGGVEADVKRHVVPDEGLASSVLEEHGKPISEENWGSTQLVDTLSAGWYCWPSNLKVYRFGSVVPPGQLRYTDPSSSETQTYLSTVFTSPEFWTKFLSYQSQEISRGMEMFDVASARFYKYMFTVFLDGPMMPFRKAVEKCLERTEEKSLQRAGAEALAGLVRGSKHWDFGRTKEMWEWVGPALERGLGAANQESLYYWGECLKFACANRDPRRVYPIVKMVFDAPLDVNSHSFFAESKKLGLIRSLLVNFHWRVLPLTLPLLRSYFAVINHPYQQVRDALGANINDLLQLQWRPGHRDVAESVRKSIESASVGNKIGEVPTDANAEIQGLLEGLMRQLQAWRAERPETNVGGSNYGNAGKTVLAWAAPALVSYRVAGTYPLIPHIMPEVFMMQDWEDQDLQKMAQAVAAVYPTLPHPSQMIPQAVQMLLSVLTYNGNGGGEEGRIGGNGGTNARERRWHVKARVLPVLQVFYFKHLHLLEEGLAVEVLETVSGLLRDPQVEVRQLASVTLSGLVRCSQRAAISTLKQSFENDLAAAPLPKRKRAAQGGAPIPSEIIVKRHAAVLGLASLVQAFPYEVPSWMPETLVTLAGCVSDPTPIAPTVSKTFTDFRRTHQDNWHEDMQKFTEDQLGVLSDLLISPSYYA